MTFTIKGLTFCMGKSEIHHGNGRRLLQANCPSSGPNVGAKNEGGACISVNTICVEFVWELVVSSNSRIL